MSATKKSHVAALTFPFASHPSVLLHLVQRLAAAAPSVTFSFFNTTVSNQKLFSRIKLHGWDNVKAYDIYDGAPEGYIFSGNPLEPINNFINATPGIFKKRIAEVVDETGLKITCLLTDAFLGFSVDIAEELGVPWVPFWTAGPHSLSAHLSTDAILRTLASAGKAQTVDRTLEFLPGLSAIRASDLPIELLNGNYDQPFPKMLYNMILALPLAKAIVQNCFDALDPIVTNDLRSKLDKVLNIGPLAFPSPKSSSEFEDEFGCSAWLNKHAKASVAYISFGTMLTPPPPELVALTEAIQEKQVPYIWSFRDDPKLPPLKEFFERTSDIGKVVPWTPQLEVLAHSSVGVFVTHCGWSSLMESIACGVPMICRPFFGDQKLNRRVIEDVWQIGVGIKGGVFTKDGMLNALDLVLSKETGNRMGANIAELKQSAEKAVEENGSSSEDFKNLVEIVTSQQDVL
ncbi:anthocyanidin 3-O-glucosyltransferase 2-like [Coffea eugenioides]|uniref:anthocyanidin 3-O-glucosyltransferase 2-like n=1 Tax=Coffea eugenioides TaxID=49369 RepID=UPI000F60DE8A|nr:anthocyanidin 3-O-glucosyltransferase 2-like [Coffea eugenioides]